MITLYVIHVHSVPVRSFITFDSVYLNMTIFIRLCIFCLFESCNLKVIVTIHVSKSGNHKNNSYVLDRTNNVDPELL